MATRIRTRGGLFPLLVLFTAVVNTGCSSVQLRPDMALDPQSSDAQAMVVVELRDGQDAPEYLRAPLTEPMLVQDALKGAGATSRFRRMNVVLVRETPDGKKLRLPVKYDTARRQVVDTNNYALHAGDWLEVTRDTSTVLDRMVELTTEPLRPMMRSYRD